MGKDCKSLSQPARVDEGNLSRTTAACHGASSEAALFVGFVPREAQRSVRRQRLSGELTWLPSNCYCAARSAIRERIVASASTRVSVSWMPGA